MKIIIANFSANNPETISRYSKDLFLCLNQNNIKAFLISTNNKCCEFFKKNGWNFKKIPLAGIKPGKVGLIKLACLAPWFFLLSFYFLYIRIIKKYKQIILTAPGAQRLLSAWLKALGYKIYWIDDKPPFSGSVQNATRNPLRKYSRTASVITPSNLSRNFLISQKIRADKIKVFRPGIDLAAFPQIKRNFYHENISQKPSAFIIGTYARLEKGLGNDYLVQAVKIAHDFIPNLNCIIIGNGTEKADLAWLLKQLGLEQRIGLIGERNNQDRWLNHFEIYVSANPKADECDYQLFKAMALGLPIIALDTPTANELLDKGESAVLVEPQNPEMLAQSIINLYHNKEWRKALGENARRRAEENFDLQKNGQELASFIK